MTNILTRLKINAAKATLAVCVSTLASSIVAEEIIECDSYFTINYPDRYIVDKENATVIDKVTGLMWDRCYYGLTGENCEYLLSDPTQLADPETARETVTAALPSEQIANVNKANTDNYRGYSDWYMPNIKELFSLSDAGCVPYHLHDDSFLKLDKHFISQPASVFPTGPSFYVTRTQLQISEIDYAGMISSTPPGASNLGARAVYILTNQDITNAGYTNLSGTVFYIPWSYPNLSNRINLFNLRLVRKVKKSEFQPSKTPLTPIDSDAK